MERVAEVSGVAYVNDSKGTNTAASAPALAAFENIHWIVGGLAKERPYPGSTTVSTVNGGVSTMINTLAVELAPIRFNAIHPGIIGDSPYWKDKNLEAAIARTPTKKLATLQDTATATLFLLDNGSINGVNLTIDNGWLLT